MTSKNITLNCQDIYGLSHYSEAFNLLACLKLHNPVEKEEHFKIPSHLSKTLRWNTWQLHTATEILIHHKYIIKTHQGGNGKGDYSLYKWAKGGENE